MQVYPLTILSAFCNCSCMCISFSMSTSMIMIPYYNLIVAHGLILVLGLLVYLYMRAKYILVYLNKYLDWLWGPHQLPVNEGSFLGCETDYSPPSSAKVRNACSHASISVCLHSVVLNSAQDNFILLPY
jgi:hypothetical protein